MMNNYICETCGVQYEGSVTTPEYCTICTEARQYVSPNGTSMDDFEKNDRCWFQKSNPI